MDLQQVNKSLKRPIKSGREYDKHFENASCTPTYLGTSNTDFTLEKMKEWTKKHLSQAKSVAIALKGTTVQQSIANIHSFLYNHIQYEIDGANQMLKSPACTWQTRHTGVDCKSFSIFASAILSNLGIAHSFRKIKQATISPDYWTHVYVVIPKSKDFKDDYWIIDATINPNIEVPFTAKKDLKMDVKLKHYGLNAPALNCACDEPVILAGTNSPNEDKAMLERAIARFNQFLDLLEEKGVSPTVTSQAMSNLEKFLTKGIEPTMSQLFGLHTKKIQNLLQFGLGATGDEPTDDTATTNQDGEVDWLDTVMDEASNSGWFDSTFGNIFGNGWDFSCWGSSYSPSQAKDVAQAKIQQHANRLGNPPTEDSFDRWNRSISIAIGAANVSANQSNLAKCTRDGYKLEKEILQEYKAKTINALKSAGFTLTTAQTGVLALSGDSNIDNWIRENQWAFKYTTFNLTFPDTSIIIDNMPDGSTGGGGAVIVDGGNGSGYATASSSSAIPLIIGGGLLAGFLWTKYKK